MCGIAGWVGEGARPEPVERMTARLTHRGPDAGGLWRGEGVVLGHRRLAVLDPRPVGDQPMRHGSLALTYNGEIVNFRALRDDLPGPFRSRTDTEVLLHLYAREGAACLARLRGMFAFAVWDARTRSLFAARDPLGIKPLYYRELPGGALAFASETKALLEIGRPELEPSALFDFFTYRYVPHPKTCHRGIHALPPGSWLEWRDGRHRVRRWWRPEVGVRRDDAGAAGEELDGLLRRAVSSHGVADVPVGVFLSGGIDSSAVAACLERPRTFSVGFDVEAYDELPHARAVAAHLGTAHEEERVGSADLDRALERVVALFDEPFGDSSAWPTHLLARAAAKRVKVALSGDGGDELFGGYGWGERWLRYGSSRAAAAAAALLPPFSAAGRSAARRGADPLARYAALVGAFDARQKRALLAPGLVPPDYDELWALRRHWDESLPPLSRLQRLDLHSFLADDILVKVDRASMAASLEVRPPLLDLPLVEFALSLHPDLLRDPRAGRGGGGKPLLRAWLAPRVPAGIATRRKRGFSMPVRRWLEADRGRLRDACGRLARRGILRRPTPPRLGSDQAWCLLVLDRWLARAA